MGQGTKANFAAGGQETPPIELSAAAAFVDGSPFTADGGGVAVDGGVYYSMARPDMVPDGEPARRVGDGWAVPPNRIGRFTLKHATRSNPTDYGGELEYVRMSPEGAYVDLPGGAYMDVKELYTFMGEGGTEATADPEQAGHYHWDMVGSMVEAAEADGQYAAAISVFGQAEPTAAQLNPSRYVHDVAGAMEARTGFSTLQTFRVAGRQTHTLISNTEAAVIAGEAKQYLVPILMAATLSGPLIQGGLAGNLAQHEFTERQLAHMERVGVRPEDLHGPYRSWRYLLRRLGSPSAGVWLTPPPDTTEQYLLHGQRQLAGGEINNLDRSNGWHTDRERLVLHGKGISTFEESYSDTLLGNPETSVPLQLLDAALFTRFEAMAMQGRDPREAVARMLGIASLSRQARLDYAHHLALRQTSRYGNDAATYLGRRPGEWLNHHLFDIADQAPYTRLSELDKVRLVGMFATTAQTESVLRQWCRANGTDIPTAQAYFDLNVGAPEVYLRAHYGALRAQRPTAPGGVLIRQVELGAGQALHQAVSSARVAA